jgi:segregation and condensation protein B
MEKLQYHIEALIFTTEHAVSLKEIKACLEATFETTFDESAIRSAIDQLSERYAEGDYAFEILEVADGFQFMTKPEYHGVVGTYLKQTTKKRLSQAALESLSIIAYKQPVSKTELESIRGVSCDYSIQKLLEKELIEIAGRSDGPGRPLLYATSTKFMDYFGLKSLRDLPKPKDFKDPESEIGEQAPIEEEVRVIF